MKIFGHRGACGYEPENTRSSFEKAIALSVPGFEFDIQLSKDGEPVVIHDETLERTTNGKGLVSDYSFAELQQFDAGKGNKILHLNEVFALADKKTDLIIELKADHSAPVVASVIKEQISKGWSYEQISVVSFDHLQLAEIKKLDGNIRTGANLVGIPVTLAKTAEDAGCHSLNPGIYHVNQKLIDDAHQRGLKVFCWTVNYPHVAERARRLGMDGIFSDVPDKL